MHMRNMKLILLGFSLMELLAVLVLLALMAILVIPIYENWLIYSNRTDAIQTLSAMQIAQERYRLTNNTYGTLAQIWTGSSSVSGHYTLSVSNVSASAYTITATATGKQAQDTQNGASCASIVLSYANNTVTKTPVACWTMGQ